MAKTAKSTKPKRHVPSEAAFLEARNAAQPFYYKVSRNKKDQTKFIAKPNLVIGNAKRLYEKKKDGLLVNSDFVFLSGLRLAGKDADLRAFLGERYYVPLVGAQGKFTPEQINAMFISAITASNYLQQPEYVTSSAAAETRRKQKKAAPVQELSLFRRGILLSRKKGEGKKPAAAGAGAAKKEKAASPRNIAARYQNAVTNGKWFDVSGLQANGHGAATKPTIPAGARQVGSTRVVSSTQQGVAVAEQLLGIPGLQQQWLAGAVAPVGAVALPAGAAVAAPVALPISAPSIPITLLSIAPPALPPQMMMPAAPATILPPAAPAQVPSPVAGTTRISPTRRPSGAVSPARARSPVQIMSQPSPGIQTAPAIMPSGTTPAAASLANIPF